MPAAISHHEALIYVMVTISAVDRAMSDEELSRIGQIVSNLPVFADYDENTLVQTAQACGQVLSADDGLNQVLGLTKRSLPSTLRETAYALAVEVAAADLQFRRRSAASSSCWPTPSRSPSWLSRPSSAARAPAIGL